MFINYLIIIAQIVYLVCQYISLHVSVSAGT